MRSIVDIRLDRRSRRTAFPRVLLDGISDALHAQALRWERPWHAAAQAAIVFLILDMLTGGVWPSSSHAYYNYLADAFLNGQLHLRQIPPSIHDLSFYNDNYYLYWGPFPAVLLAPLVALFGVQFSDILFNIAVASLNVALVAVLLRLACLRGILDISPTRRGALVLFFAVGTTHFYLARGGGVWHNGQLVGFACVAFAYLAVLGLRGRRAFFFTGLALAAAMLTRNHLLLAGIWPAYYLLDQHRLLDRRQVLKCSVIGILPIVVGIIFIGWYNWARFDSVFENGLTYHRMASVFVQNYERYGFFNIHYIPINLYYQYLYYPFPIRATSPYGGSLFLLSPVFFAAFLAFRPPVSRRHAFVLLATILATATPILLLMGTGWVQFGPRYTMDFTVPLLLLTAIGVRYWPLWLVTTLTIISVAHYVVGVVWLHYFLNGWPSWLA